MREKSMCSNIGCCGVPGTRAPMARKFTGVVLALYRCVTHPLKLSSSNNKGFVIFHNLKGWLGPAQGLFCLRWEPAVVTSPWALSQGECLSPRSSPELARGSRMAGSAETLGERVPKEPPPPPLARPAWSCWAVIALKCDSSFQEPTSRSCLAFLWL